MGGVIPLLYLIPVYMYLSHTNVLRSSSLKRKVLPSFPQYTKYNNVQVSKPVQLQDKFQNFAYTLWKSVLQHPDRVSKPKRRLSWKEAVQPLPCMDAERSWAGSWWSPVEHLRASTSTWQGQAGSLTPSWLSSKQGANYSHAFPQHHTATLFHVWRSLYFGVRKALFFFTDHHHGAGFFLSFLSVSLTVAASTRIKICGSQL